MTDEYKDPALGEKLVKQDVITREELAEVQEREASGGMPWFRQLLQMKKMSFGALEDLLWREFHPKSVQKEHESLGQALVKLHAISSGQLKEALAEQERNGRLLGNILLDRGYVTRETISRALSAQHQLEYADLEETPSAPDALECVPESMARKYEVLPVRLEGDKLVVLIDSPQTYSSLRDMGVLLGKRIHGMLTTTENMRSEITKRYRNAKLGPPAWPRKIPSHASQNAPGETHKQ